MDKVVKTTTSRGAEAVDVGGYIYRRDKQSKTSLLWRCLIDGCHGRLRTSFNYENPTITQNHHHLPDQTNRPIHQMRARLKERAATEAAPIPEIYNEEIARLSSDPDAVNAIAPPFEQVRGSMYNSRHKKYRSLPKDISSIEVPEALSKTLSGEDFLQYKNEIDGTIIVATTGNLKLLEQSPEVFIDGTFKTAPKLYYQLFTFHCFHLEKQVPLVYCLLLHKTAEQYIQLFRALRDIMSKSNLVYSPKTIVSDYETGLISAIRQELPGTEHHGCLFHFTQAIYKKLQELGLVTQYRDNINVQTYVRQLMALPFLSPTEISSTFHRLKARSPKCIEKLLSYFSDYWLNTIGPEMLSVFNRPHRTNNALESWHARFNKRVARHEPNIFVLLEFIRSEQASTEQFIKNEQVGRKVVRSCGKTRRLNQQIARIADQFSRNVINEEAFLRGIGYCIHEQINRKSAREGNYKGQSAGPSISIISEHRARFRGGPRVGTRCMSRGDTQAETQAAEPLMEATVFSANFTDISIASNTSFSESNLLASNDFFIEEAFNGSNLEFNLNVSLASETNVSLSIGLSSLATYNSDSSQSEHTFNEVNQLSNSPEKSEAEHSHLMYSTPTAVRRLPVDSFPTPLFTLRSLALFDMDN